MKLLKRTFSTDHLIVEEGGKDPIVYTCFSKKDGKNFGCSADGLTIEEAKQYYSVFIKTMNTLFKLKRTAHAKNRSITRVMPYVE